MHGDPLTVLTSPVKPRPPKAPKRVIDPICSIEECSRPTAVRGWCVAHYSRWQRHGDPLVGGAIRPPRSDAPCLIETCGRQSRTRGYCSRHYVRLMEYGDPLGGFWIKGTIRERFDHWVPDRPDGECWSWTGALSNEGYGQLKIESSRKYMPAHRYAYEHFIGPISEDYVIDHLCHTNDPACFDATECAHRRCCNPAHMEPVTNSENLSRAHRSQSAQTHCKWGHEFTAANTYHPPKRPQVRQCNICRARRDEESRRRRFYRATQ